MVPLVGAEFPRVPFAPSAGQLHEFGSWGNGLQLLVGLLAKLIMHVGKTHFTLRIFLIEVRVGNEVFVKHAFLVGTIHEGQECFPFFRLGLHRYQLTPSSFQPFANPNAANSSGIPIRLELPSAENPKVSFFPLPSGS